MNNPIITKTMLVLFSVPILSQASVEVDLSGIKKLIAHKTQQESQIDTAQLEAAAQSLAMSAEMSHQAANNYQLPGNNAAQSPEQIQDERFRQLMQNLTTLTHDPLAE